ncbi:arsenite efflux transporter metallochaperone ArsD [Veillonella seminalis]|uniref:arsenite efflux transporter metallochaperone ArsD n=1 Tax=Veillonella seminalis TaxID=1502943 RepID=UPI0026717A00|nr:arsenite efflux transporter metallochaperone ArsD [Veillonella seminalis]
MKSVKIFEPAMCCATGLCGVGVDPELLRISTVIETLKQNNIQVDRFNLTNAPMEFVNDTTINTFINEKGPDALPAILLDGDLVLSERYPTNAELTEWLNLPAETLQTCAQGSEYASKNEDDSNSCCCEGGCC